MQYLCKKPSLSGLDRQIFGIFFLWGFVSVLIGGIVGGSVLTALNPSIVSEPSKLHSPTIPISPYVQQPIAAQPLLPAAYTLSSPFHDSGLSL